MISCFFVSVGLVVALALGSALLRAAVSVSNRIVRPPNEEPEPFAFEHWDWDGEPEDALPPREKKERRVPEPGVGKGMLIALTAGALTALFVPVLAALAEVVADALEGEEEARFAVLAVLALPLGFVVTALLLAAMLPTTFGRAALVAFVYHCFGLILLVAVGGTLAVLLRL